MGRLSSGRVRLAALVVVALGLAAGGIAYASIPDSNGAIHGCYQKNSGQLRVVDPGAGGGCSSSESPLVWNQFSGYEVVASPFHETAESTAFAVFAESASCPPGKVVLSGGVSARFVDAAGNRHPAQLDSSAPTPAGNGWDVQLSRSDGGFFDVGEGVLGTVYAICAYAS